MANVTLSKQSVKIEDGRADKSPAFAMSHVLSGVRRAIRVAKGEVRFTHGDGWAQFDYGKPRVEGGVVVVSAALNQERAAEILAWLQKHGIQPTEGMVRRAARASEDAPFLVAATRTSKREIIPLEKWSGWRGWQSYAVSIKLLTGKAVNAAVSKAVLAEALKKYLASDGVYRAAIERKMAWREARGSRQKGDAVFAAAVVDKVGTARNIGRFPDAASAYRALAKAVEDGLDAASATIAKVVGGEIVESITVPAAKLAE